jgi:hypothetical protein
LCPSFARLAVAVGFLPLTSGRAIAITPLELDAERYGDAGFLVTTKDCARQRTLTTSLFFWNFWNFWNLWNFWN